MWIFSKYIAVKEPVVKKISFCVKRWKQGKKYSTFSKFSLEERSHIAHRTSCCNSTIFSKLVAFCRVLVCNLARKWLRAIIQRIFFPTSQRASACVVFGLKAYHVYIRNIRNGKSVLFFLQTLVLKNNMYIESYA